MTIFPSRQKADSFVVHANRQEMLNILQGLAGGLTPSPWTKGAIADIKEAISASDAYLGLRWGDDEL
jgi:hypothetical protein